MNQSNQATLTNLLIPVKSGYYILPCENIILLEAESNYCYIHMEDGSKYLVSRTLKWLAEKLQNAVFVRVHKRFLVNLRFVTGLQTGRKMNLQLINGENIMVSRSQRGNLRHHLHNLYDTNFID